MPEAQRQDLARMGEEYKRFQEADYLRKMGEQGMGLAKSVARGVPQMATGLVDLAAMPFEAAGVLQPGQAVGSTKWLESKGYLPEAQPGFINQTVEGLASALDPSTMAAHAIPMIAGTFIGKGAKTWDALQAAEAMKRLETGENAANVYKETGYLISPWDKQLRKEISDVPAKMKPTEWVTPYEEIPSYHQSTIGGAIEHPELFNAYPEYKNTGLYLNPQIDSRASWHRADPEIGLESYMQWKIDKDSALNHQEDWVNRLNDPNSEDYWKTQVKRDMEGPFAYNSEEEGMATMKDYVKEQEDKLKNMKSGQLNETPSDILHEVQHGIQEAEGWARGGSPKEFAYDKAKALQEVETVNKQLNMLSNSIDAAKAKGDLEKAAEYKQMYDEAMDYKLTQLVPRANIDPTESYSRLAGEAEARLVQRRRNLTEEQMRELYPYERSYFHEQTDVPLSSLIVKYDKTQDVNKPEVKGIFK